MTRIEGNTDILYLYITAPWITFVNNFQIFTNLSETVLPTNMYYIPLERSFYTLLLVCVA